VTARFDNKFYSTTAFHQEIIFTKARSWKWLSPCLKYAPQEPVAVGAVYFPSLRRN